MLSKGLGVAANQKAWRYCLPTGPSFTSQDPGLPSTEQSQGPATPHPDPPPLDPGYVLRTRVHNRWTLDLRSWSERPGIEQVQGCWGLGSPLYSDGKDVGSARAYLCN